MNHMPEPWAVTAPTETMHAIRGPSGRIVADVGYSDTFQMNDANARRIVACVNASAGIPQETLDQYETPGYIQTKFGVYDQTIQKIASERDEYKEQRDDAERQRDELLSQRDELLEALLRLLPLLDEDDMNAVTGIYSQETLLAIDKARAAVEKAIGQ